MSGDNFRGLENTLQTLILAENSVANLPLDAFTGLPLLETLDLRGNHLAIIDSGVFRDGMSRLNKVIKYWIGLDLFCYFNTFKISR